MKLRSILAAACAIALIAAAPAFAAKTLIKDNALASYYGAQYHGRPTSSGEIFDMYGMTAAHRTLPFGTMLEISNLENGNSVVVRVNDRGPYVEGREIDVSLGAAEKLGMIASGVARVSISILDDAEVNSRAAPPAAPAVGQAVPPAQEAPSPDAQPPADMRVQTVPALQDAEMALETPAADAPPAQMPPLFLLAENPPEAEEIAAPEEMGLEPPAWDEPPAQMPPLPPLPENPPVAQEASPPPAADESAAPSIPDLPDSPVWRIQLGSFLREENAIRLVRQIRAAGLEPAYERNGETVRVVIAGIKDSDLESVKGALDGAGLYDYIIRKER